MALWVLSFCIMAIEAWGIIYFFDTFLKKKGAGWLQRCRYVVLYFVGGAVAVLGGQLGLMGIKVLLIVLVSIAFCAVFYRADWKQCIFFSMLNYSLLFLIDLFSLQIEKIFMLSKGISHLILPVKKMVWLCLVFLLRRMWKGRNNYGELSGKEWLKFSMVPLLTVASMLLMFFCNSAEAKVQTAYLFLSVGLIFINIFVIELLQGILEKEELFRESALAGQKKESQLAHYRDMQAVYERQGRKMHDYKNQIRTIQVLLKKGDTQTAAALAERQGRNAVIHVKLVQEGGKLWWEKCRSRKAPACRT
jgi:two-component system sensor histidine kinase AgrC